MTEFKVEHCGPLTIKTTLINGEAVLKTFYGPETVVERQFWPKFGEIGNKTTYEANEIEIEYVKQTKEVPYILNGYYLTQAKKLGWSKSDIDEIEKSLQPDEKFFKIFASKNETLCAAVDAKYEKLKLEMDAKLSLEFLKDKSTCKVLDLKTEIVVKEVPSVVLALPTSAVSSSVLPELPASKGFRSRLNAKLAENKILNLNSSEQSEKATTGISARIKKIKSDKETTEQISTLFVNNVPLDYDENDIRESLNNRFNISRVNIVRKIAPGSHSTVKTSIGSAFIVCNSYEDATLCLQALNGHRWGNLIACASFSEQKQII